jgi:hypothetical protein
VLTAQAAGTCGYADEQQLDFAKSAGRVLVTFDTDFLALHKSGIEHAGIAWCPERKYEIGQLIQVLQLLHGVLNADEMKNHAELCSKQTHRWTGEASTVFYPES